jgi:hypothetical protein
MKISDILKRKQKSCTKPQNEIFTTSTIANYVGEKVEVLWNINDLEGTDCNQGGSLVRYNNTTKTMTLFTSGML